MAPNETTGELVQTITRGYSNAGSGSEWLHQMSSRGFRPLASWGRDGWDLGEWPCVAYAIRERAGTVELLRYIEGDLDAWEGTADAVAAFVDDEAVHWWEQLGNGPDVVTPDLLGPYRPAQ